MSGIQDVAGVLKHYFAALADVSGAFGTDSAMNEAVPHRFWSHDRADHANHMGASASVATNEKSCQTKGDEGRSCAARADLARG